ncbi:MAG: YfhO family protein, partial [Muriicola sp.]
VILAAAVLWLFIKSKIKQTTLIVILGALICLDLVGVALRYVNGEDFVSKRRMNTPFVAEAVDKQILSDTTVYRVYDTSEGLNGARTSYFHKSIGGYHAAKPAIIQDLFDYHIYQNNRQVLNMLNVKYVLQQNEEGQRVAAVNPEANGNAWFIELLFPVRSANEEIMALDSLDLSSEAVVNTQDFPLLNKFRFEVDSTSNVRLLEYQPNRLVYVSSNGQEGVVVFSELYYANGWNAYLDGKKVPYFKVNYGLRALQVPSGEHKIMFAFEPEVVQRGSTISLASSLLLVVILVGGGFFTFWRRKKLKQ